MNICVEKSMYRKEINNKTNVSEQSTAYKQGAQWLLLFCTVLYYTYSELEVLYIKQHKDVVYSL